MHAAAQIFAHARELETVPTPELATRERANLREDSRRPRRAIVGVVAAAVEDKTHARRASHQQLARAARLARTGAVAPPAVVRIRGGRGLEIIDVVVALVSAERALTIGTCLRRS